MQKSSRAREPPKPASNFPEKYKRLHLRIRVLPGGDHFALIIDECIERPESARLTVRDDLRFGVTDVVIARDRGVPDAKRNMAITVPVGRAVCLKLKAAVQKPK